MKYTISDENRWTTLSAYVEHHLFYEYASLGLPKRLPSDKHDENNGITMKLAKAFLKELRFQMYGSYKK